MRKIARGAPLVINKNLGSAELTDSQRLTTTTSEGLPVVPPTDQQKYDFDRNGWLLIPGLLTADELAEMRRFGEHWARRRESIRDGEGELLAGPLQRLIDHPVVIGFLNEFLAYAPCASEDSYGFRLEASRLVYRSVAGDAQQEFRPHNGSGLLRPPWDSHYYRCVPGKVWSGLTRVVWELNPVRHRQGGTLFISGSHKAAYPLPGETLRDEASPLWDTYGCPAGSLIIFSESITHSAATWSDREHDRLAIFNLYNALAHRWHNWLPPDEVLAQMPAKRRSLFRPVWVQNNVDNGSFERRVSPYVEADANG